MYKLLLIVLLPVLAACDQRETDQATAGPAPAAKVVRQQDTAQIQRGQRVYEQNCAACHGERGKGQPGDWRQRGPDGNYPPPPLDDSAHAWHHPTAVLKRVIAKGGVPGGNMPAWQGRLSEGQIDDVVAYIKSLWSDEVYAVWDDIERRSLRKD